MPVSLGLGVERSGGVEAAARQVAQLKRWSGDHVVRLLTPTMRQVVALSCTELELLLGPGDADVPLLASSLLHVRAALAVGGGDR